MASGGASDFPFDGRSKAGGGCYNIVKSGIAGRAMAKKLKNEVNLRCSVKSIVIAVTDSVRAFGYFAYEFKQHFEVIVDVGRFWIVL